MPGRVILIWIVALEMKDGKCMTQIILKLAGQTEEMARIEDNKTNAEVAVSE
jgi:hypothetical protein